ncbi:MAG: hypothetical protein ACI4LE_07895, partial [Faecalibacterium sp.]
TSLPQETGVLFLFREKGTKKAFYCAHRLRDGRASLLVDGKRRQSFARSRARGLRPDKKKSRAARIV